MTEIHAAFHVKLPEHQGEVFLSTQGLKELRDKINTAIGAELPDRCPPGVSSDKWFQHQANMANQQARRQEAQKRDAHLRADTVQQTARNIVVQANASQAGKLTWRIGDGEPDARVAVWEFPSVITPGRKVYLRTRRNQVNGKREYQYAGVMSSTPSTWQPWARMAVMLRDSAHLWTEAERHSA